MFVKSKNALTKYYIIENKPIELFITPNELSGSLSELINYNYYLRVKDDFLGQVTLNFKGPVAFFYIVSSDDEKFTAKDLDRYRKNENTNISYNFTSIT